MKSKLSPQIFSLGPRRVNNCTREPQNYSLFDGLIRESLVDRLYMSLTVVISHFALEILNNEVFIKRASILTTLTTFDSFRIHRVPIANVFCARISCDGWATSQKVITRLVSNFLSHFRSDWRPGGVTHKNDSNKGSDDESSPLCLRLSWPGGSSMLIWLRLPWLPWKHPSTCSFKIVLHPITRRVEALKFCGRKPQVCSVYCNTADILHKFLNLLKSP